MILWIPNKWNPFSSSRAVCIKGQMLRYKFLQLVWIDFAKMMLQLHQSISSEIKRMVMIWQQQNIVFCRFAYLWYWRQIWSCDMEAIRVPSNLPLMLDCCNLHQNCIPLWNQKSVTSDHEDMKYFFLHSITRTGSLGVFHGVRFKFCV